MTDLPTSRTTHVLLADDDALSRSIVRQFLSECGSITFHEAADGRQAVERIMTQRYDLVVVDQNMPFITGDRIIRLLQSGTTPNAATPVIHLTASADAVSSVDHLVSVVPKPVRKHEFLQIATSALGSASPW